MTTFTAQWLAYAILILQAIIFVFYLLMLITKVVEGFIRLFGGVHFDESTHPLDGGLLGAIADLDCLNPRGGKAAERKRRKRGSKQLQRNVSAAGSLTTQMMLDRHSMGVMRPVSDGGGGTTPFLLSPPPNEFGRNRHSDQPPTQAQARSDHPSYFPAYTPPLGPPPMERLSSDSRSDEPHAGGNIMDAWHPHHSPPLSQVGYFGSQLQGVYPGPSSGSGQGPIHGRSQSSPNAYGQPSFLQGSGRGGFAVISGGRADITNPYAVKNPPATVFGMNPGSAIDRSATISPPPSFRVSPISPKPTHSRQHSSSAIIESFDTRISPPQTPLYPPQPQPTNSAGMRMQSGSMNPNNTQNHYHCQQGLIPPVFTVPKRRSLNNLREDIPTGGRHDRDDDNDVNGDKKKKKRRSWFKTEGGMIMRDDDDDDDEVEITDDDEPESGPSRPEPKQNKSKDKSRPAFTPAPASTSAASKGKSKSRMSVPLKEPAPFEPVPTVLDYDPEEEEFDRHRGTSGRRPSHHGDTTGGGGSGGVGGILGYLGLRRKKSLDDFASQVRDENKARKAALAAESGAMLFGVQPTPVEQRSFKVTRRDGSNTPRSSPVAGPSTTNTKSGGSGPMNVKGKQKADGPGPSSEAGQVPGPVPEPRSFKVKRAHQNVSTPTAISKVTPTPTAINESNQPSSKSFKVMRPNTTHAPASGNSSAASSFVVNRPRHTPPPALQLQVNNVTPPYSPRAESPQPHASPAGHVSARGKASMFRSAKGT